MLKPELLIKKYFEQHSFVESNILSFNNFVDHELPRIVADIGNIEPPITPPEAKDFRINFDKINIVKPILIEADGSKRDVYPTETRLRYLTYSAPMNLDISVHMDGIQRESFTTE